MKTGHNEINGQNQFLVKALMLTLLKIARQGDMCLNAELTM